MCTFYCSEFQIKKNHISIYIIPCLKIKKYWQSHKQLGQNIWRQRMPLHTYVMRKQNLLSHEGFKDAVKTTGNLAGITSVGKKTTQLQFCGLLSLQHARKNHLYATLLYFINISNNEWMHVGTMGGLLAFWCCLINSSLVLKTGASSTTIPSAMSFTFSSSSGWYLQR